MKMPILTFSFSFKEPQTKQLWRFIGAGIAQKLHTELHASVADEFSLNDTHSRL